MAQTLHEEDVLVAEHAHLKPLRRTWERQRQHINRRAFHAAIFRRRELDVQQAQAKGWLPDDEQLMALPAFQRARALDEAGPEAYSEQSLDLDAVLRRREEREQQRAAAQEAARAAAAEEAARQAAAKAAAAQERRAQRQREREEREQRRAARQQERERRREERQEEKVLRQQDRLLEKKEQKVKRRAEQEKRHAAQVASWEESVADARRQVAEAAAQGEAVAGHVAEAEARLAGLMEEKHAMVLRLKQALQAEEERRQREAALAALEEGEMMPSPPQAAGGVAWAPGLASDAAPGSAPGMLGAGARGGPLAFPDRSPGGFNYAVGLLAGALGGLGAYPQQPLSAPAQRAGSFGAGAGAHFSPLAGAGSLLAPAGPGGAAGPGPLPYVSPLARPGLGPLPGEGPPGGRLGAPPIGGPYYGGGRAEEEARSRLGGPLATSGGRVYGGFDAAAAPGPSGSGLWSPRSGGPGGGGGGLASPRDLGAPPFAGGDRPALRCYVCGEPGHFARECPQGRGGGVGGGVLAGTPQSAGGPAGHFGGPQPYRGYPGGGGGGGGGMTYAERQRDREMRGMGGGAGPAGGYGRRDEGAPGSGGSKDGAARGDREGPGRDGFARGFSSRPEFSRDW